MKEQAISRYLDHAVLKPELTQKEALEAIQMGIDYRVRTVCVRPCDIDLAVEACRGTETEVCTVVAFPHGVVPAEMKAEEARNYIKRGVKEIDMVVNYGYIKSGRWDLVERDIRAVVEVTRIYDAVLKVIFETSVLTTDEVEKATEVSIEAGADFVKTSTGFNGGGAAEEAVAAMLRAAKGRIRVKPSGGIRDVQRARMFIELGADRLGVNYSSTPAICQGVGSNGGSGY